MKTNPWQRDYVKASILALYVHPIIHAVSVLLLAVLVSWLFGRIGVFGEGNRQLTFFMSLMTGVLSAILYFVLHLNAKVDLLKRTVDPAARERTDKQLWV
jgi:hypothetical protein